MKKILVSLLLAGSLSLPALAAEPSLHAVYQAADAGRLAEAQQMMKEVLQNHPNSAKAHYVEAELLARDGHRQQAADELATAERLAPGLPFATAQSVSSLRARLGEAPAPTAMQHAVAAPSPATSGGSLPWGTLLLGGGLLLAFIVWASRFMSARSAPANNTAYAGVPADRPAYPASPYAAPAPVGGYYGGAPAPAASSGLGSQILGGLATGAAVGAGVVAGEALMHHFMDGDKPAPDAHRLGNLDAIPDLPSTPLDTFGGNDFGIADAGSWDDAGGDSNDWS